LEHAAALALRMVERSAMTGRFELAGRALEPTARRTEEAQGGKEVRELLARAEHAARTILRDRADPLGVLAETLFERETLTAAEVESLASGSRQPAPTGMGDVHAFGRASSS
jgi:ATP-dependent Zn protease